MRVLAFAGPTGPRFGIRQGDMVATIALPLGGEAALFQMLAAGMQPATDGMVEARGLTLLAPVPAPGKVICLGLNYAEHAKEGGNPIPDYPAVFLRVLSSLAAPGDALIKPAVSDRFDYEAELAVVIGKRGHGIAEADALSHVAGYSCFNDGSLRDYQRKSTQWTMGKNFDRTGAFGPELVTPDELPPGAHGLRVRTRLNGETLQDGDTADMIFPVARTIAILSEVMTLEPGDVIITGTPSGVGYARKPPVFMRQGDVVEIEIEGIGILRNPVVDEVSASAAVAVHA